MSALNRGTHPGYQEDSNRLLRTDPVKGRSSNLPDNQAASSDFLFGKSEGHPPEDTVTGWAGVIMACASPSGYIPELVSADGDDPLVTQASLDQLRR
jgi:hypothetical protein